MRTKNTKQFRTHPVLTGGILKMSRNKRKKKLLCVNEKLLTSETVETISLTQYKSNTYNFTTIRVTNNLKI